ncbi:MAG: hypothetical protein HZA53_17225 [Planctomycetes bacterium]|nr:hypothetical protein [Planctomycetota bacterium]
MTRSLKPLLTEPAGRPRRRARRGGLQFAACVLGLFGLARALGAEPQKSTTREAVEKVDPYTRGKTAAFDRAGYVSLGPFPLTMGIKSADVEETIGGAPILWVETTHFRIGSTLATYTLQGDAREARRLKDELAQLKPRFERFAPPANKLDPWLRLHLAAWRVEALYDDLLKRIGLVDEEFDPERRSERPPGLGGGRYLGMEHKFVVLLFEDESSLARFGRRFFDVEAHIRGRWRLPGGAMGLAITAEGVRSLGFDLDAALTGLLVGDTAQMLIEGLNENVNAVPLWFLYGLSHFYSRGIDPRWTVSANGTLREFGDDSWKWEPRVARIVANDAGAGWSELQSWRVLEDVTAQGHMLAWSRVTWLLQHEPRELRTFVLAVARPLPGESEDQLRKLVDTRVREGVQTAFGRTLNELDADWRAWVLKTQPR